MHILDVVDEIADKLPELKPEQIAHIYNLLATWGATDKIIAPSGEAFIEVSEVLK